MLSSTPSSNRLIPCFLLFLLTPACQQDPEPEEGDMSTIVLEDMSPTEDEDMSPSSGDMMPPPDLAQQEDATPDLSTPSSSCSPDDLDACRYLPAISSEPGPRLQDAMTFSYQDITGARREVPFDIRLPTNDQGTAPLIVWSHGGSGGKSNPLIVAEEWGEVFNRAGFAFITIAHERAVDTQVAQCEGIGAEPCQRPCTTNADCQNTPVGEGLCVPQVQVCQFYKVLGWDRPHDFKALLDFLESEQGMAPRIRERVDLSKILYAGHSAGAGSAMMISGAGRTYVSTLAQIDDPRPLGFMNFSPQPPGEDGFTAQNYAGDDCKPAQAHCLTRPHLVITGVGDGNVADDEPPKGEGRREAFRSLKPSGNKTLFYITEEAARHTTFEHSLDACERFSRQNQLNPERCSDYHMWMESVALAFADAILREDARAAAYLASDDAVVLSGNAAQMERR